MSEVNFDFDGIEEGSERIGSGYNLLPSQIHALRLNQVYVTTTKSGGIAVTLDAVTKDEHKVTQTFYVTNAKKESFYIDKRSGKKMMLPSMLTINNLCKLLGFKSFGEVYTQRKLKAGVIFDWESRKEITKQVEMLTGLCGKVVAAAIVHRKENKSKKVGTKYVPINEARESNVILAFLHKSDNRTAQEIAENADAKYVVDFLAKYEGKVDDLFKAVEEDYEDTESTGDPLASNADSTDDDFI